MEEILEKPPNMYPKPCKQWDKFTISTGVSDFFQPVGYDVCLLLFPLHLHEAKKKSYDYNWPIKSCKWYSIHDY